MRNLVLCMSKFNTSGDKCIVELFFQWIFTRTAVLEVAFGVDVAFGYLTMSGFNSSGDQHSFRLSDSSSSLHCGKSDQHRTAAFLGWSTYAWQILVSGIVISFRRIFWLSILIKILPQSFSQLPSSSLQAAVVLPVELFS